MIRQITENKKQYLALLLLADEQESMIDEYLERGEMYVLEKEFPPSSAPAPSQDGGSKEPQPLAVCVVTDQGEGVLELKNLAVSPQAQRKGLGRKMIRFLEDTYRGKYEIFQVGTGESPLTLPFYEKCGFTVSHRLPDFFTEHYDHPILVAGVVLRDMIYLRKKL